MSASDLSYSFPWYNMGLILNWLYLDIHNSPLSLRYKKSFDTSHKCLIHRGSDQKPSIKEIHTICSSKWGFMTCQLQGSGELVVIFTFLFWESNTFYFLVAPFVGCTQVCRVGRIWRLKYFSTNAKYTAASWHWHGCLFGGEQKQELYHIIA